MIGLFQRKRKERPIRRAAAQKLMQAVLVAQRRLANRLNARAASWTRRQQYLFLGLTILAFSLAATGTVLRSFQARPQTAISIPQSITVVPLAGTLSSKEKRRMLLDLAEVRQLRRLLDSLSADSSARRDYRRFMDARPGLLDSLAQLEAYYEQLTKTK